jgi:hypothetical protein
MNLNSVSMAGSILVVLHCRTQRRSNGTEKCKPNLFTTTVLVDQISVPACGNPRTGAALSYNGTVYSVSVSDSHTEIPKIWPTNKKTPALNLRPRP